MLSFPQWATPWTACHKLQDELILYYLFIDTVRRLTQPQTDTLAKRRCTGMFAGQACNRRAGRHLSDGNRMAGCRWHTAILICFCVTSCSAAAYLCCCLLFVTSWMHLWGLNLCLNYKICLKLAARHVALVRITEIFFNFLTHKNWH